MFKGLSLGNRLLVLYTVGLIVLIGAVSVSYYTQLRNALISDSEGFVKAKAYAIAVILETQATDQQVLQSEIEWQLPKLQYHEIYARIISLNGKLIAQTKDNPASKAVIERHLGPPNLIVLLGSLGKTLRSVTETGVPILRFAMQAGNIESIHGKFIVQVAMDLTKQEEILTSQRTFQIFSFVLVVFIVVIIGSILSRIAIGPIQRLVSETAKLDGYRNHQIRTQDFPSELQPLVEALNLLHDRIQDQINKLSRFAENIAHQVRNPINILIGEAEITLSRNRSSEEYRDTLFSALEEYRDLAQLVNSLLFIARAENSAEKLHASHVEVDALVTEIIDLYEPLAVEKKIQLKSCIEQGTLLWGDPLLIKQALGNLVSNAIQYGNTGSCVRIESKKLEKSRSVLSVEDEGPGIPADQVSRIFERFYRIDRDLAPKVAGSGLGLAIVKSIVSLHRGEVKVQSELGKGTKFILNFPADSYSSLGGWLSEKEAQFLE